MPNRKIQTEWKSDEPNPDEAFLKSQRDAEVKNLENSLAMEAEQSKRRLANIEPLLGASGLKARDIDDRIKEAKGRSKKALAEADRLLATPPFDIEALHKQELDLVKEIDEKMPSTASWQGYIHNASYCGYWSDYDGETEEIPSVTCDNAHNRVDPRTQAYGEGWYDGDHSRAHAYVAFRFSPPSWGHLHVRVGPWLHGYYSLYSDDEWYNSEHASAQLHTWVDLHQNFWRSRDYRLRFSLGGNELHPTRSGRIDSQYWQSYYTDVGQSDTVTIRVGAKLYDYARAGGSHSKLNFQAGSANYVYVPNVYWYLHH